MASNEAQLAAQANRLYWQTDASVDEIIRRLGISRRALYEALRPEPAGVACPACGTGLVYANRRARIAGEAECPECTAVHDIEALRAATAEAGSALREAAARRERADRLEAREAPPEMEQEWDAGPWAPLDVRGARLRRRAMLLAGAALLGAALGAAFVRVVTRR